MIYVSIDIINLVHIGLEMVLFTDQTLHTTKLGAYYMLYIICHILFMIIETHGRLILETNYTRNVNDTVRKCQIALIFI